jgi:hypothetical protein
MCFYISIRQAVVSFPDLFDFRNDHYRSVINSYRADFNISRDTILDKDAKLGNGCVFQT